MPLKLYMYTYTYIYLSRFSSIHWKKQKSEQSVVLLISEVDKIVKKNIVQDSSKAKAYVIVILECSYDFTKNVPYYNIAEVSSRRPNRMKCQSD